MNSEIPEVYAALRRMENDMKETFPAFKASNVQVSEEAVTKILKAFIFYRPDVGYVKVNLSISVLIVLGNVTLGSSLVNVLL
jgi:TBC domain.